MGIENPVHLLFIAAVALVVLGPRRLPEMARALGKGMREFRQAMSGEEAQAETDEETEKPDAFGGG
jgi:sec-independent protein translocase protein TatA